MPTRRAFAVLSLAAAAAFAAAPPAHAVGSLVDVQVVDRSQGETLSPYYFRGQSYVAGRPGNRYALRLTNRSGARVLVVLSVDGVNAVTGETAAVGQNGYVLAPYASTEITGWRKNLQEAAAFYFTALPDSYAARTNRPDNVGVIGAAVFRERQRPPQPGWWEGEISAHDRASGSFGGLGSGAARSMPAPPPAAGALSEAQPAAPAAKAADSIARQERLGTGHGEREYAPVTRTEFERASDTPNEVVRLRYDSYPNLLASGVIPRPRPLPWRGTPEPFPGFVPDPG